MNSDSIHRQIRHIREAAGLSQAAMAEELGIGRTTYINFETGKTKLFSAVLSAFLEYFKLSESEVLASSNIDSGVLAENPNFEEMKRTLTEEYEKRLSEYQKRCTELEEKIAKDEQIIDSLTQTNRYLISQLHKND